MNCSLGLSHSYSRATRCLLYTYYIYLIYLFWFCSMLKLNTSPIFSDGLQTVICTEEKGAFLIPDLDNFRFLRFISVFIIFKRGSQSIDEKIHLLQNRLQLFKTAFSDLGEITLSAKINKFDQSQFHDHTQLLDHIREQLLPICDSSPFYSFHVDFQSDNDGAADFIAQILQMRPIIRCRDVLFHYINETFIQLPVEVIANWLDRNSDHGIGCIERGQSKKERMLAMNNQIKIQNAVEICDRLKIVIYSFLNALKFSKCPKILKIRIWVFDTQKAVVCSDVFLFFPKIRKENKLCFHGEEWWCGWETRLKKDGRTQFNVNKNSFFSSKFKSILTFLTNKPSYTLQTNVRSNWFLYILAACSLFGFPLFHIKYIFDTLTNASTVNLFNWIDSFVRQLFQLHLYHKEVMRSDK